jgi:hypothetical protein
MADQFYQPPDLPAGIKPKPLVPEHLHGVPLTPDTIVTCIQRGTEPVHDKFDGKDYVIEPGYFSAPYGAARHFQTRAVVPGSRNPETGKQESFIGILSVDRPDRCEPFSEEQCQRFGLKVEAIAREELSSPSARQAHLESVNAIRARMPGAAFGSTLRPEIDLSAQASPEAEARAADALTPPAVNEAQVEMAQTEAEMAAEAASLAQRRADAAAARAANAGRKAGGR